MRLGILKAGRVNPKIVGKFGEYPKMFERLLCGADPSLQFEYWPLLDDVIPDSPEECDGWVVTGSRHSVYEDLSWIGPARTFLRRAVDAGRPVLGICFGHQLLAEALGGRVEKSERGWGIGVQTYDVWERPDWMPDAPDRVSFHSVHQDQVVEPPPGATVVAGSEFCPFGALALGDAAFSIQLHPEFTSEFSESLVEALRGVRISDEVADAAHASLAIPTQAPSFARWARDFLAQEFQAAGGNKTA